MSQKKMIFIAIAAILVGAIAIGMVLLSGKSSKTKAPSGPKEITVWVVGDESAGFEGVISGFKKNTTYKDTQVVVSKFATYRDYE